MGLETHKGDLRLQLESYKNEFKKEQIKFSRLQENQAIIISKIYKRIAVAHRKFHKY